MSILQALVLGFVEGVTEFLPISSTGHLVLASSLLSILETDFVKTFLIVIQLGAILAVLGLYWKSFLNLPLLKRIIVAFIPTGIIGLALYHTLKTYLLGNNFIVLAALFLGGVALIFFEKLHGEHDDSHGLENLSYKNAFFIGLFQALAIIPGVSRSGATIVGGLLLRLKRAAIVEFSFLLAAPTMIAASGLSLYKSGFGFSTYEWAILAIGFCTSFLVALIAIRWFLGYVRTRSFTVFGWYRIALSVLFVLWLVA